MYFVWYLREEWIDFSYIGYSNQIPCVADACKIAFGSMRTLSNCDNIFLKFYVFLQYLRKKWVDFVHMWYSNQPTGKPALW